MPLRALFTLAIVFASSRAQSAPLPSRETWHAVATPPRASLPAVTIELGYPGPYIPADNAPITLRATAGDIAFDGYIGYHLSVKDRRTLDVPVIARAVLQPHQEWTFTTFVAVRRFSQTERQSVGAPEWTPTPRDIVIEWRNRSMNTIAVRNAGLPPWTLERTRMQPLRVIPAAGEAVSTPVLGGPGYIERADQLSDRAQWYAGFKALVIPIETWFDLPLRIREAIFGSAIEVMFFGFPRPNQQLDALGAALLPVAFSPGAASYVAPWPYGEGRAMPLAAPMSWTAKPAASTTGAGELPYIARTLSATWAADEVAATRPLPAMVAVPTQLQAARNRSAQFDRSLRVRTSWPRPDQLLRVFRSYIVSVAAIVASIAGWMLIRRRPRLTVIFAVMAMALLTIAARNRIRPQSGSYAYDIHASVSPGIMTTVHARNTYGSSPLAAADSSNEESLRTSRTDSSDIWWEEAEVRTSDTAPWMGRMQRGGDWDSITRWTERREPGDPAVIRIRSREGQKLVLDYETAVPIQYVNATWLCGDTVCFGGCAVPKSARGTVTVAHATDPWPEIEPFAWDLPPAAPLASFRWATTRVELLARDRNGTQSFRWSEWPSTSPQSFVIGARLEGQADGSASSTFALPIRNPDARADARISVRNRVAPREVELTWSGGRIVAVPEKGAAVSPRRGYVVPQAVLQNIVATGGIVTVTVRGDKPIGSQLFDTVWIEAGEKKP